MTTQSYIFMNVNQQQIRHFFKDFESEVNEIQGYFLAQTAVFYSKQFSGPYDNEPDDLWSIVRVNPNHSAPYITYYEMPTGWIVKFVYDEEESENITDFINEIIDRAKIYGMFPEVLRTEDTEIEPLENYKVNLWDDTAVRLWNQGISATKISVEIGKAGLGKASPGRVRNCMTDLRNLLRKEGKAELIKYHRLPKKNK